MKWDQKKNKKITDEKNKISIKVIIITIESTI